jgi:hypothetical protein
MNPIHFRCARGVVALCALFVLGSNSARAEFLTTYTGNTLMADSAPTKGVVSFTVFHNTTSNWVNAVNSALGLTGANALSATSLSGGGALDLSARYVYLYQVVNTTSASINLIGLQVLHKNDFTSAGYFPGKVFMDSGKVGAVGTAGNVVDRGLGIDPLGEDVLDGQPSHENQTLASIHTLLAASQPAALDPGSTDLFQSAIATGFVSFNLALPGQRSSSILFLTSNRPPTYGEGMVDSSLAESNGDIPTVLNPEPATLLLAALGIVSAGGVYTRRWLRRRQSPQAA